MKLDRNKNPDGRGKYAVINLRKVDDSTYNEMLENRRDKTAFALDSDCLQLGDEKDGQFFVLKYKDVFAAPALRAYARACRRYATEAPAVGKDEKAELLEFADEIDREAIIAAKVGKALPT